MAWYEHLANFLRDLHVEHAQIAMCAMDGDVFAVTRYKLHASPRHIQGIAFLGQALCCGPQGTAKLICNGPSRDQITWGVHWVLQIKGCRPFAWKLVGQFPESPKKIGSLAVIVVEPVPTFQRLTGAGQIGLVGT